MFSYAIVDLVVTVVGMDVCQHAAFQWKNIYERKSYCSIIPDVPVFLAIHVLIFSRAKLRALNSFLTAWLSEEYVVSSAAHSKK